MVAATRQKHLGAFYTPPRMAQVLVDWAVRAPGDRVLDPSFGGLVFFEAARARLAELGARGDVAEQLYGVDIDADAFAQVADSRFADAHLVRRDFFRCAPDGRVLPAVEAVVGNPPYVRYQTFKAGRTRGRKLAARHDIKLTGLASSWAPFLVHGVDFVAPSGRLAQVLPAELIHAQYASKVLGHVCERFERVVLVMFEEAVFPGAQEEVVLLLAEGKAGGPAPGVEVVSCRNLGDLEIPAERGRSVPVGPGHKPLVGILDPAALEIYDRSRDGSQSSLLGEIASVDIGAVTGANEFFLVGAEAADMLPGELLRPAISKATHVPGAVFRKEDLASMAQRGIPTRMLVMEPDSPLAEHHAVQALLAEGVQAGVSERYKCRVREPWWSIPRSQVRAPHLFLTYMAADLPRLVVNEAGAMSTNTVHGVTLLNGADPRAMAACFYNSLTLLSVELVGRSYGGGVLKLEPTEAERVVLPRFASSRASLLPRVDALLRARAYDELIAVVDQAILVEDLGLASSEVGRLRAAAELLRRRRRSRASRPRV